MASILEKAARRVRDWHGARQLAYLFALCGVMSAALAAPAPVRRAAHDAIRSDHPGAGFCTARAAAGSFNETFRTRRELT